MKRKVVITKDGSKTIHLEEWNESYHSTHGAIQEAQHVYLNSGFKKVALKELSVLEFGFGTGLNALMTYLEAIKEQKKVAYTTLEAYPVGSKELLQLDYVASLKNSFAEETFQLMHSSPWDVSIRLSDNFTFEKRKIDFRNLQDKSKYDLVFYDAFGPRVQPELWTQEMFLKVFSAMKEAGVLVTYSCKGSVRRAMIAAGFTVEKIPGPPGKREMLRAIKPNL